MSPCPPPPGLSCVSAITTGPTGSAQARRTASSADSTPPAKLASRAMMSATRALEAASAAAGSSAKAVTEAPQSAKSAYGKAEAPGQFNDARRLGQLGAARHDGHHGAFERALARDRHPELHLPERLRIRPAPRDAPAQQSHGTLPSLLHVHMRIGAVGHDNVHARDHQRRHVGVRVERDHHRHAAHDRAETPQQFALGIRRSHGEPGTVQIQHDTVHRRRIGGRSTHQRADPLERLGLDRPCRRRMAPEQRHGRVAASLDRGDGARRRTRPPPHGAEQRIRPHQPRMVGRMQEIRIGGRHRRERMAFVQEPANGNAHRTLQSRLTGQPYSGRASTKSPRMPPGIAIRRSRATGQPGSASQTTGIVVTASIWAAPSCCGPAASNGASAGSAPA